jgi:hypothetical protein
MKIIILLLALVAITLQILDRSYYDALGTSSFTEVFLLVQAKTKFGKHIDSNQGNIILTEIQDREIVFKRLMLV